MMLETNETDRWIEQIRTGGMEERREASRELGKRGEAAVGPLIEALAGTGDDDARWYYAVSLARVGRPALAPLIAALRERRDPDFRRYAAASLAQLGPDAVDPLVEMLGVEGDEELRDFAALALNRIGEPAIEALTRAVEGGGTLGAVAGLVLWRMEEAGLKALAGVCNIEEEAAVPGPIT